MKSLTLLLMFAFLVSPQWALAQDDEGPVDDSPVVEYTRSQAFAKIKSEATTLTTNLFSGKITPEEFRSTLANASNDFYVSGQISLAQHTGKIAEIEKCIVDLPNTTLRKVTCAAAVNFNGLEANQPACTNASTVLAGSECCGGLVMGVSSTLEASATGKKQNQACNEHSECASKVCSKATEETAGVCAPVMGCFPTIPLNSECSPENPNCQAGACRRQDYGLDGVSCKILSAVCSAADECCSGKCTSGKCQDKYICEMCLEEGAKPAGNQQCCRGFILGIDGMCTLEMPPFILPPPQASVKNQNLWRQLASNIFSMSAIAQDSEVPAETAGPNTSQGTWVNDEALSEKQLDLIEAEVKKVMNIKDAAKRKAELLKIYAIRKKMAGDNAAAIKAGKNIGKVFTQEEYVQRYNIPAITPKERSNVEMCEFDTGKDNWLDSSNLLRNADLFVRSFETSYSGRGTQDMWHLLDASGKANPKNLYTRTKDLMKEIRENRYSTREQLKYLDLLVSCQCMYTFGPEKFSEEKKAFFYTQCTGQPENKICRDGEMRDALKLPESAEQPYKDGVEFPNYVAMYMEKLDKMASQGRQGVDDIDNIDSGAAGINHEEVLVRWLRLRSCNQIDVFMDTEKVETELQTIAEDINRAKKPVARLTSYWNSRLSQMKAAKVDKTIIQAFENDKTKDSWYRGYVHTESKVHSWKKKTFKFLLFLLLALLVVGVGFALGALAIAGAVAGGVLGVGLVVTGLQGNPTGGFNVVESFSKDFPNVMIEDRLVEKKSCGFLKLFYCKTFYRILHWPAFSNNPGIEGVFPWKKKEDRTCDGTHAAATSYPGIGANPCSGPFKGTMCARSFYRPLPDATIAAKADFQPWKEVMADKTLMDPVLPEFFEEDLNLDYKWVAEVNAGFKKGCAWAQALGKKKAVASDKAKFFPDFDKYIDAQANFRPQYQFTQARIDQYKKAVKKYALCRDLRECGAVNLDGQNENPWGHGDIFCPADTSKPCSVESEKNAELFANYVYQLHFNWRHMSGQSGIGYPLAYLENYYLALLHNIRLLTTLSIRRGIELDDAFNRYNEDLAIRRGRYQISGDRYGLTMGENGQVRTLESNLFRSFRSLGFPLSSEFVGLPAGGGLPSSTTGNQGSASGSSLSDGFELRVLNAARRTAGRVAKDNKANLNFQNQIKGNAAATKRLAAAGKFFGQLNSPLSSVSGLSRPGDNSAFSGIGGAGGSLGAAKKSLSGTDETKTEQKFGPVSSPNGGASAGGGSGSSSASSGFSSSGLGSGDEGSGAFANSGSNGGGEDSGSSGGANSGAGAGADGLGDAARRTGMKEGDLRNMLDSADRNRNDGLAGSENDSLFEKVSKAYMRNLDRVLLKTKGAEKPGKKDPQADPEKEEIKKIFNQ